MSDAEDFEIGIESAEPHAQSVDQSTVLDRIERLESTVNHITEQQAELTHTLNEHASELGKLADDIGELSTDMSDMSDELDKQDKVSKTRFDGLNDSMDDIEEELQSVYGRFAEETQEVERRVLAIENTLDMSDRDIARAIKPNACELEQLSMVPNVDENATFNVRTKRAVALYEQFDTIAEPVRNGGKRVLSKNIKTFLAGRANTDIAYSQVQRVIDTFLAKTGDEYQEHNADKGRAVLWNPTH